MTNLSVPELNELERLDEQLWLEYIFDVDGDEQQYLTYQMWLIMRLKQAGGISGENNLHLRNSQGQ